MTTATAPRPRARLTVLNAMADGDLARSLAIQRPWGIVDLDLRDALLGKRLLDLDDAEAARVAEMARAEGFAVHCLSMPLFHDEVDRGEAWFRAEHLARIGRVVELAGILRPRLVRLLAARSAAAARAPERWAAVERAHPWLAPVYAEAIAALHAAGVATTIENEVDDCALADADDVVAFFAALARAGAGRDRCAFTWDAQNLWQAGGHPPDVATYRRLRPLIGYLHLKGGRGDGARLRWRTGLAGASWPVTDVARAAVADGVSPVICLNPSHGEAGDASADDYAADLAFLRARVEGIA